MSKYRIRLYIAAVLLILVVVTSTVANCLLFLSQEGLLDNINRLVSPARITVRRIFFFFPNKIILKNVVVRDENLLPGDDVIVLKDVAIRFSLAGLLNKKLSVSGVVIRSPRWEHKDISLFFKKHFDAFKNILEKCPRGDIRIFVKKGIWGLTDRKNDIPYLENDLSFILKREKGSVKVSGSGLVKKITETYYNGEIASVSKDPPLNFHFNGAFHANGFLLDKLVIEKGNIYANLWGNGGQGFFRLNGFAFINPPSENVPARRFFDLSRPQLKRLGSEHGGLFILDVDAVFMPAFPHIEILQFNFLLNHVPFRLKGHLDFQDDMALDLVCSLDSPSFEGSLMKNLKRADFKIAGDMKANGFNGSGEFQMSWNAPAYGNGVKRIEGDFKALRVDFNDYSQLFFYLRDGRLAFWTNESEHRMSFQDLRARLNCLHPRLKILEMNVPFYGGMVDGRAWFDSQRSPLKTSAVFLLNDVDANRLDPLLIHFSKVHGRLFSKIYFRMGSEVNINGEINVKKGSLRNFDFFNWMADTFELPALKKIDFKKAAVDFLIDKENIGLDKIQLESGDLAVRGYFNIDKNGLVSSKLALGFPRDFLSQSAKLRRITEVFDEQVREVVFDFQLSGNQHAMNFQWLDSEHKEKIRATIPDFIERIIERRVDKAIQTPGPEQEFKVGN